MASFRSATLEDLEGLKSDLLSERPKHNRPGHGDVRFWDIVTTDPAPWDRMLVEGTYDQAVDHAVAMMARRPDGFPATSTVSIEQRQIHRAPQPILAQ